MRIVESPFVRGILLQGNEPLRAVDISPTVGWRLNDTAFLKSRLLKRFVPWQLVGCLVHTGEAARVQLRKSVARLLDLNVQMIVLNRLD